MTNFDPGPVTSGPCKLCKGEPHYLNGDYDHAPETDQLFIHGEKSDEVFALKLKFLRLAMLADELVKTDGHSVNCAFNGCNCGATEAYKAARADYIAYRRAK